MNFLRVALLASSTLLIGVAHGASNASVCAPSAQEAVATFVKSAITDGRKSVELMESRSLSKFRARLQQLLDDRYSPDSREFRVRFLGAGWSVDRLTAASDRDLVGSYLAAGEERRRSWSVSEIQVEEPRRSYPGTLEVSVSYRLERLEGTTKQTRQFNVIKRAECWTIEVPIEAWVRTDQLAKILKESRDERGMTRSGPARATLRVAPGGLEGEPRMQQFPDRESKGMVWVDETPLLTESDLESASASWDCEPVGLGPEEPAVRLQFAEQSAKRLTDWSIGRLGRMLAVVVNGKVEVYARVSSRLGSKLSLCMRGGTLEEAQAIAADLMGAR